MNEVVLSAEEAFEKRFNEVESVKTNPRGSSGLRAIYGTASERQGIITAKMGFRPRCLSNLVYESEPRLFNVPIYGEKLEGRYYSLPPKINIKEFKQATRDELNLFMCLANPDMLNDEQVKGAFFDRLSEIQEQEKNEGIMSKINQHESETTKYSEFFGMVKGAVRVDENLSYYPEGYVLENDVPEM